MVADTHQLLSRERGASAVLIAFGMTVLLGVAAIAIDLSAAFNERNQNQIAGDNGVMAGAMEKADQNPDAAIVDNALDFVRANLTADFTGPNDPNWIAMWQNCVDAGNPNWVPLPQPAAWGGGTLDCVSQTTSLLRIRIPDQLLDTTFGRAIGARNVTTNAVSIAKTVLQQTAPPVVPFGLAGSASTGELCMSSAGPGTAYPPCDGPQSGAFGSIISPLFGDFGTHEASCIGNQGTWFERNIVFGLDHQVEEWSGALGIPIPTSWPGNSVVLPPASTNRDACILDPDGNAAPADGLDINTLEVDSGFPNPNLTRALVSDTLYEGGQRSRLQQGTNPKRAIQSKVSGSVVDWDLDNVGPWMYLDNASATPECTRDYHTATLTDTAARVAAFNACLTVNTVDDYELSASITSSPRFVWVPQYTYELPGAIGPGGGSNNWMPIRQFRPAFIGGVFFNCNSSGCDLPFYPDETVSTPICDPTPGGCQSLSADQFSAWIIPNQALPQSVFDDFDAAFTNLEPELYQ
jgi:hypothetical protein